MSYVYMDGLKFSWLPSNTISRLSCSIYILYNQMYYENQQYSMSSLEVLIFDFSSLSGISSVSLLIIKCFNFPLLLMQELFYYPQREKIYDTTIPISP